MRVNDRRAFLAATLLAAPASARAQAAFPDRPVTLIVPWPPGGGTDVISRMVAEAAQQQFRVPVVVVNKPGAGGAIGLREVANAPPDGLTIGVASNAHLGNQYTNPNANSLTDFEWFLFIGEDPAALAVRAETGFTSVAELVAAAKAKPGGLRNANDPPGGSSFVWITRFEQLAGIKVGHVTYAGYAPSLTALLSGEVQMTFSPLTDLAEQHKGGRIRVLGVASDHRHFLLPEVPTLREAGIDLVSGTFRALVAPKGVPPAKLQALEAGFAAGLADPEFRRRTQRLGFDISPRPAAETLPAMQANDQEIYAIMAAAGLVKTRAR